MVVPMANTRGRQLGLSLFLLTPALIVAGIMWYFAAIGGGAHMDVPPIGAGAGSTGGANAIGELLAGHHANRAALPPENSKGNAVAADEPKMIRAEDWDGGILLIVEDRAKKASSSKPMYLASIITGWQAGDPRFKLESQSDGRWRLQLPKPDRGVDFKFTLGNWDEVEVDATGKDIENRMLPKVDASKLKPGEPIKVELAVVDFRVPKIVVLEPYRTLNVTGTLKRLPVRGGGGSAAAMNRDALIWLPPGYDAPENATRTYPVLYMFDGQNLFDKPDTAPGEWGIDEVATALIKDNTMEPIIIVGIQHAGDKRTEEYLPPVTTEAVSGSNPPAGASTLAWVLGTVKPRVERAFRVKAGAENTAIGGSSLGGLMSLYAGSTHPEVFGKVLAESPSLGFGKNVYWKSLFQPVKVWPSRVYIGVGGSEAGKGQDEESKAFAGWSEQLDKHLESIGLGKDRLKYVFEPQAEHNEAAWNKRLPQALQFLFPAK